MKLWKVDGPVIPPTMKPYGIGLILRLVIGESFRFHDREGPSADESRLVLVLLSMKGTSPNE